MDTLDGAAAGVDHSPERGVSALVTVVTYAVHVPVGRNSGEGNENQERKKKELFHQKPPILPETPPPPGMLNPPEAPPGPKLPEAPLPPGPLTLPEAPSPLTLPEALLPPGPLTLPEAPPELTCPETEPVDVACQPPDLWVPLRISCADGRRV